MIVTLDARRLGFKINVLQTAKARVSMIANLMMYDRPELNEAHKRYWQLIRSALAKADVEAPEMLSQTTDSNFVWLHPELVLSQTCGMPYRNGLHGKVQLVGTPDFGLEDCPAGYYRSALIVRANETRSDLVAFKDAIFAYNETVSQSGYAAAFSHVQSHGFWFGNRLHTGGHLGSAKAVAEGRADLASLDAVTWRNIEKYDAFSKELRILEWTAPTPGLPLITSLGQNKDVIYAAVARAIDELTAADKAALGLEGIVRISEFDYLAVPNPIESAH